MIEENSAVEVTSHNRRDLVGANLANPFKLGVPYRKDRAASSMSFFAALSTHNNS